jgi:hypothetical protein
LQRKSETKKNIFDALKVKVKAKAKKLKYATSFKLNISPKADAEKF